MRGSRYRVMVDLERQIQDNLQARLESGEPLHLPDPSDDEQQSAMLPAEVVALISQLPPGEEQQRLLRRWYEAQLAKISERIAATERQIGADDNGEEVFESDDPVPGLVELPAQIGQAAADGDIDSVLAWLGPAPASRVNARWTEKLHRTLLMEACFEARLELIEVLLDLGADINATSMSGQTALYQACTYRRLHGVARLLLRHGATLEAPCASSPSIADLAQQAGNRPLAELLRAPLGGRHCRIHSLNGRPDLNGSTGVAVGYSTARGRYTIDVDGTSESVRVRPANLCLGTEEPPPPAQDAAAAREERLTGLQESAPQSEPKQIFVDNDDAALRSEMVGADSRRGGSRRPEDSGTQTVEPPESDRTRSIERMMARQNDAFRAARKASGDAAAAVVSSGGLQGISIWGTKFSVESIALDDCFVECAVPALVGVPLMAKPLPGTERACDLKLIDRVMVNATTRLPPSTPAGAAPKVLFARADGVPFGIDAWAALDDYICQWLEIEDPVSRRSRLRPDKFGDWLHYYHMSVDPSYLNLAFPVGLPCEIRHVQTRQELNGHRGTVVCYGTQSAKGRVKLKVPHKTADGRQLVDEVLALKPKNLKPLSSIETANVQRSAVRPFQRLLLAALFHQSSHFSSDLLISISKCLAGSGTSPFSHAGAEVLVSHREEFQWHTMQNACVHQRGTAVIIHGLVSASHYNGKCGFVRSFNLQKGRYVVALRVEGDERTIAAKPSNLRRAKDTDVA
jgi:hypothetical protein